MDADQPIGSLARYGVVNGPPEQKDAK